MKFISILTTTVICFLFSSCNNGNIAKDMANNISNAVVLQKDSTVNTTSEVSREGTESEGFGRCLESGCYCKEFKGRGQTCRNCGHAYNRHY